jgi:putative NADH-flavin reductase
MLQKKRILVLGATGKTGQQIVSQALQGGHSLTVMVRDPNRLTQHRDRVQVVVGSVPDDYEALSQAVRGQDAVISALGVGNSLKPQGLITRSMSPILRAMEAAGVRRLVFLSAYGVGSTHEDTPWLPRFLIRLFLSAIYEDKEAGEKILRESNIDWTLVYATTLKDGPLTGRYRAGEHLELHGLPRISRADVAQFLLAQVDDERNVRKGVLLST